MEKIRIQNDIDIVVELKDETGQIMQPQSLRNIAVVLSTGLKKHKVEDFTLLSNGVGFRFKASEQARTGVYDISVTAETADGRVFTTDVCKAFELVARSCEAGGEAGEVEVESVNVAATFAISAGGSVDEERIEALEKGKQDKIEDLEEIRKGAKLGATALQEYYDDGSHEVVPVKHPDLSTQPSILPYKFAGNYVYEQMVWVDGEKFTNDVHDIDLIRFEDYKQNGENNIILNHHIFIIGDNYYGNYTHLTNNDWFPFEMISDDKHIFLRRAGSMVPVCKGVWIRVVWTSEPKRGGYYYYYNAPESKYNFHIKGFEGLSLSLDGEDLLKGSIEAVKLSDAVVEKFSSGTDIVVPGEQSGIPLYVKCEETSEQAYMSGGMVALSMRDDSYSRVLSINRALPNVIERLKNGEKITLVITKA